MWKYSKSLQQPWRVLLLGSHKAALPKLHRRVGISACTELVPHLGHSYHRPEMEAGCSPLSSALPGHENLSRLDGPVERKRQLTPHHGGLRAVTPACPFFQNNQPTLRSTRWAETWLHSGVLGQEETVALCLTRVPVWQTCLINPHCAVPSLSNALSFIPPISCTRGKACRSWEAWQPKNRASFSSSLTGTFFLPDPIKEGGGITTATQQLNRPLKGCRHSAPATHPPPTPLLSCPFLPPPSLLGFFLSCCNHSSSWSRLPKSRSRTSQQCWPPTRNIALWSKMKLMELCTAPHLLIWPKWFSP